jgi:epoxide hydrolase-like predicted phosphatase
MIKSVLFDFGGVLTEGGKNGFKGETLAELYGVDPSDMDIGDLHYMMRRGLGTEESFFEELNKRYHGNLTKEEFLEHTHALTTPAKEVYELAETLRAHGIKTGILSNVFAMSAEQLRREGKYDGFDPVILSCEEGCAKPDEKFYETAIARVGVKPEEILFIDDQSKCIPPAQKLGMRTIVAVSPEQIVADTKTLIRKLNGIDL